MSARFEQISPHILIMHAEHQTDRPILAAITGTDRTLLLDAGNSPAHAAVFREELQKRGIRQPELLVLTHWHWDHTFGMSEWKIPSVSHVRTSHVLQSLKGLSWTDETLDDLVKREILSEQTVRDIKLEYGQDRNIHIETPTLLFEESITIDLGGLHVRVTCVGGDHAEDSCYVFVKEDRVLFLGDALGPSVYGGPRQYTADRFLTLLDLALQCEADCFVESHGTPMDGQSFLADISPWEMLAKIVLQHGKDREKVEKEMKQFLQVESIPHEFEEAINWFMVGEENR